MSGIKIDGLDLGESGKMVGFGIEGRSLFGGGRQTSRRKSALYFAMSLCVHLLYSHTVLYQPFVNCFCRMRHENTSPEVGLGKDVGQR